MIVAEVRAADVPVKILGLDVERKRGGQDFSELGRNPFDGVFGEIGWCIECGFAARIESSYFVHGDHLADWGLAM